jgi:amino acid transporter
MLLVALVFGELASHYPVAGALYQYSKFSVGPRYGWFVGWFYGIALLITVAAVDTGVVSYVTALTHNWFGWQLDPTSHLTILVVTVILLAIQTGLNITGARVMGRVAQFGVYVEIVGTVGIAIILALHGFHHGLGFLFSTQNVQHAASNPLGLNFGGNWLTGAALISVLAPVYIFYGFEAAGDISEETKDAGRQVPRAMRMSLIWGGLASFILIGALLLAMPSGADPVGQTVKGGGVTFILSQLPSGVQDLLLLLIIFAFFSCGTSVQGAGSRLAFSYARDGALPKAAWIAKINQRFRTPINALLAGAVVTVLFVLLVFASPNHDIKLGFAGFPGVLRRQRHLPVVPVDRHRVDRGQGARVDSRGQFPPGQMGVDGQHPRRGVPGPHAHQRRRADGPGQPPRLLQPRLDHLARDGCRRGRRRGSLRDRAPGSGGR